MHLSHLPANWEQRSSDNALKVVPSPSFRGLDLLLLQKLEIDTMYAVYAFWGLWLLQKASTEALTTTVTKTCPCTVTQYAVTTVTSTSSVNLQDDVYFVRLIEEVTWSSLQFGLSIPTPPSIRLRHSKPSAHLRNVADGVSL